MQLISFFFSSHSARTSKQYPGSNHQPNSALLPSMAVESFVGAFFYEGIYRQYIGAGCIRSALTRKKFLVSKGIYRQYIGTGCTRSALAQKIIC